MYSNIQHLIAAIYLQSDIQDYEKTVLAMLLTGVCDIISLLYLLNSYSFELYISAIVTNHVESKLVKCQHYSTLTQSLLTVKL